MGNSIMQQKIDALTAPATVATGSIMLFLNQLAEEGLPLIVQYGNALLILAGVLLAISKWRTSRVERKTRVIECEIKALELANMRKEAEAINATL